MAVKIKSKRQKKLCHKRKLKFQNYKSCLETTKLDNNINYTEKNKIDVDSFLCYKRKPRVRKKQEISIKNSKNLKVKGMILLKKLIRLF